MTLHLVHEHPFTFQDLLLLPPAHLASELSRLQNSISHLERSNDQLLLAVSQHDHDPADGEEGEEGRKVYLEAREDNLVTMSVSPRESRVRELMGNDAERSRRNGAGCSDSLSRGKSASTLRTLTTRPLHTRNLEPDRRS